MKEAMIRVHPALPPTRMWTYDGHFPGPTFDVERGERVAVEWVNALPPTHFLPVDETICGMHPGAASSRSVVHVHGGRTPAESDGYPDDWYLPGHSKTARYPNDQAATTLWYHDHAMGVARLNHYAGLMGVYRIHDPEEAALGLPDAERDIPLLLVDRYIAPDGGLYYPTSGIPGHPWTPEVRGNMILVNGRLAPYLDVAPGRYRFRLVNGSNQRFFRMGLAEAAGSAVQIGSDQGLLAGPVAFNDRVLAPAERADIVVDFSAHAGQTLTLNNDDRPILQFRVADSGAPDESGAPVPTKRLSDIPRPAPERARRERLLSLDEFFHPSGQSMMMLLNNTRWYAEVSEDPILGTTEIWHLINTTEDTHPIHLHLVRFRVLDRRPFDIYRYRNEGRLRFYGPPRAPQPGEHGWKDTVQAHAGMVTRILVPFEGYPGRYVWHCHIWEHAANEMMRPYILRSADTPV